MGDDVSYDKSEMNKFVQDLYNQKMQEGKHGHYETMFNVVHKAIERANMLSVKVYSLEELEGCLKGVRQDRDMWKSHYYDLKNAMDAAKEQQ